VLIAATWARTDVAGFTNRTKFPSFYRMFLRLKELGVGRNKRQSFTNGPDVVLVIVNSVYGNQPSALWKFIGSSSYGSDAQERREWTLPAERFGPGSGCMPQNSTSAYCQGYAHVTLCRREHDCSRKRRYRSHSSSESRTDTGKVQITRTAVRSRNQQLESLKFHYLRIQLIDLRAFSCGGSKPVKPS